MQSHTSVLPTLSDAAARPAWTDRDIPDQSGRSVLVTGANSGLGLLTSWRLAEHGAHVIMAVRDLAKGRAAQARIAAAGLPGTVELRALDLADLVRVRTFAQDLLDDGSRIDVLVNNAGIMMPPRSLTAQGHELQFGVNHLAHFMLTGLLLPRLADSAAGRVVTVSSDLHRRGRIHFDDLAGARRYGRIAFYAQSKLANVLFGLELQRQLQAANSSVSSLLAHPGYAATNLQLSGPTGLLQLFMRIGNRYLAQSAAMGVLPQLYAATAPAAAGGDFIGPDSPNEKSGYPTVVAPAPRGRDAGLAARLWQRSMECTAPFGAA